MRIIVDIEVTNPEEVLKAHRGDFVKLLTDVILTKESKKRRVEKAVCEEVIKVMEIDLPRGLKEEMVEANIKIRLEEGEKPEDFMV